MPKYGEVSKAEFGGYVLAGLLVLAGTVWFLGRPANGPEQNSPAEKREGEVASATSVQGFDKLPEGFPQDFPFSPSVEVVSGEVGGRKVEDGNQKREYRVQLKSTLSLEATKAWYTSQLPKGGWKLKGSEPAGENGYSFFLEKEVEWSATLVLLGDPETSTSKLLLTVSKP